MKKLIFFAYNLGLGGIETALINLLNNIDYGKYDVTLVLEKKEGLFLDKINPNVHVKEYHVFDFKLVFIRKLFNYMKRLIWTVFNKNKYDFSCAYATYSLMGCKLAKIVSSNSSFYIHNDYVNIYDEKGLFTFFDDRGINEFKTVFFVSNEARDNLLRYYPSISEKAVVCNNFVDSKRIIDLSKKGSLIKKHDILFVYVGRLSEVAKRIFRMLNLIKALKEDYSVELWLVGDGEDAGEYKKYIEENNLGSNIKMFGAQKNPYPYMAQADYILMTSDYEGFPVTYLEAAILNKKIITTLDRSDEFVKISNGIGYIVSKEDEKLVAGVKDILNNDNLEYQKIDFEKLQSDRIKFLEKIFDGDSNEKV